jgi:cadmium resistance protein CadD (predicted permease)
MEHTIDSLFTKLIVFVRVETGKETFKSFVGQPLGFSSIMFLCAFDGTLEI